MTGCAPWRSVCSIRLEFGVCVHLVSERPVSGGLLAGMCQDTQTGLAPGAGGSGGRGWGGSMPPTYTDSETAL